jgi:predicted ATPase
VSPVLVGRQAELGLLRDSLDRAVAGGQATVLVGGEAGVGKSRLVHDLIVQARQSERERSSAAVSSSTAAASRSRRSWR